MASGADGGWFGNVWVLWGAGSSVFFLFFTVLRFVVSLLILFGGGSCILSGLLVGHSLLVLGWIDGFFCFRGSCDMNLLVWWVEWGVVGVCFCLLKAGVDWNGVLLACCLFFFKWGLM